MKKVFILLHILIILCYSGVFENTNVSSKSIGLGGTNCDYASDASSFLTNPATLTQYKFSVLTIHHNDMYNLGLLNNQFIGYIHPFFEKGSAGIGIKRFSTSNNVDFLRYQEVQQYLSYAYNIYDNISVGMNIKLLIADSVKDATGVGVDLGTGYYITNKYSIGISVRNLNYPGIYWETEHKDILNPDIIVSMSYNLLDQWIVSSTFNYIELDIFETHLGTQIGWWKNQIFLRGGMTIFRNNILSFGAGLGIMLKKYSFDYALQIHDELGMQHNFTLSVYF